MLVLSEHVAMTGVAMTFRYQAFMIRRQTFCEVGVTLGRLFQASPYGRQTFCEVGVTLGRLFQASPYGLPLHVTWDNWKMYFCSAELLQVLADRHLVTKVNDFPLT